MARDINTFMEENNLLLSNDGGAGSSSDPTAAPLQPPAIPRPSRVTKYTPKYRSGGWGILVGLLELDEAARTETGSDEPHRFGKDEVIAAAAPHSDADMTSSRASQGQYYSAFSSMSTLLKRELVQSSGRPTMYALTAAGFALAKQCRLQHVSVTGTIPIASPSIIGPPVSHARSRPSAVLLSPSKAAVDESPVAAARFKFIQLDGSTVDQPNAETQCITSQVGLLYAISLPTTSTGQCCCYIPAANVPSARIQRPISPSQLQVLQDSNYDKSDWELCLLVDNRERGFNGSRVDWFISQFTTKHIPCYSKSLSLGDFTWIVRPPGCEDEGTWMHVPVVIERKELDDLRSSIQDGRWQEQRNRFRKMMETQQLLRCIYCVEGEPNAHVLPVGTLEACLVELDCQDGFSAQHCRSLQDVLSFITAQHFYLQRHWGQLSYPTGLLASRRSFSEWQRTAAKNDGMSLQRIVAHMIVSLPGVGDRLAAKLSEEVGTLTGLMAKYRGLESEEEREMLLKTVSQQIDGAKRSLGTEISRKAYHALFEVKGSEGD